MFSATLQHPQIVQDFYKKTGTPLDKTSCCKKDYNKVIVNIFPQVVVPGQAANYSADDDSINADGDNIVLTFPYNIEDFISGELFELVTKIQEERNSCYCLQQKQNISWIFWLMDITI